MAKSSLTTELGAAIESLRRKRAEHQEAIDRIDEALGQFGIDSGERGTRRRAGRRKKKGKATRRKGVVAATRKKKGGKKRKKKAGRRRRGTFKVTGDEAVVAIVRRLKKPSASQVNKAWTRLGRRGTANNTLTRLVQGRKLKRIKVKGERGGRYGVA